LTPNCKHHPDRPSTHVVDVGKIPVCDECAVIEDANGLLVLRHRGYLWGLPIVVRETDVLDAEYLED